MTKIMNICDSVTTSTVRGRRPHFWDALIEENILYFTLIWDFFTTIPSGGFRGGRVGQIRKAYVIQR